MEKTKLLTVFVLIFVLFLGSAAYAQNKVMFSKARGKVNMQEVGGKGLYVFSLWDEKKAFVGKDDTFVTTISNFGPQKLIVKDENGLTRAMAIALPENAASVVFDARSTAIAILFQDPQLLEVSSLVEEVSARMPEKKSFQKLVEFLKKNLPRNTLQDLANNTECTALLDTCNAEIFGQDKEAINKSLSDAEAKLRKLFKEQ